MSPDATPLRHNFARIINSPAGDNGQPSQQFLLRLAHEPYLASMPPEHVLIDGEPFRAVIIDAEVPRPGDIPKPRRAVLQIPSLPAELFGAPLLAAFVWQDCAAFNKIWDWVDAGTVDPVAVRAAQTELQANLLYRLHAAWPEHFHPSFPHHGR